MKSRRANSCLLSVMVLIISVLWGCQPARYPAHREVTSVAEIRQLSPAQISAGVQAHLHGILTYAFANDEICFVQDATGGVRIQLRPGQMLVEPGKAIEVWGTVGAGGAKPLLRLPRFRITGNASLPEAVALDGQSGGELPLLYRRVSVTGVVQSAVDMHIDTTALELRVGRTAVHVKAASPTFSDTESLVDSEIRIAGVLAVDGSGDSDEVTIWAPALTQAIVVVPARAPQTSPLVTIAKLRSLVPKALPQHRVRLRGRLENAASGRQSLSDQSGRIDLIFGAGATRLAEGPQTLAAFATLRNNEVVLANAVDASAASNGALGLPMLDTALAVHQLTAEEASRRYPVGLRGVVTYADAANGVLFVQDRTDGIFLSPDDARSGMLVPGDWIEVRGETTPGDFAPSVTRAHFRVLGHAPLPQPDKGGLEEIFQGKRDCRWIEVAGVIQTVAAGFSETIVQVLCGTHRLQARVLAPPDQLAPLIDAEVKLRGVAGALFNDRRQLLGSVIYVPGRDYIQVERAAPDPFKLPLTTADRLLQFSLGAASGHRVRLSGVVTATEQSGPTVIRDNTAPLIIQDHNDAQLKPGDVAEAVGFLTTGAYSPLLTGALIRRIRAANPPVPQPVTAAQVLSGSYDGELVQIEGVLNDSSPRADRLVLGLKSGNFRFAAEFQAGSAPVIPAIGAQLRVTGICALEVDDSRESIAPRSFTIRMRSPADLTIVKQPPWLTLERLLPVFLITLAIASVALAWATRLRRRLDAQANKLKHKNAQLEKEQRQTTLALHRAREAELMEQAHKHVLELVVRDEDLERVLIHLAQAVEEHCIGAWCSIQLRLPEGRRLSASPSLMPEWQPVLAGLETRDFCAPGVHPLTELSQAAEWQVIMKAQPDSRMRRFFLVPIEWESRRIGAVIAFLGGDLVLRQSEKDFLISAGKLAALAVERHLLYDQLSYQAQHDDLTGLDNRAAILARLDREIRAAAVSRSRVGVIYIDLDNFKNTNDTFGHGAGDVVLCEVARRMLAGVRRTDAVARMGGDEFVIVLPGTSSANDARRIAGHLVASLSRPLLFGGNELKIGASAGVSVYPDDGEDEETLLRTADRRMYKCKSDPDSGDSGGNGLTGIEARELTA